MKFNVTRSSPSIDSSSLLDYDSSDSFCLIPSTSEGSSSSSKLRKENATLKAKLDAMEKQMSSVRRQMTLRTEQDQQLRDHIMLARKEVRKLVSNCFALTVLNGQHLMTGSTSHGGVDSSRDDLRTVHFEHGSKCALWDTWPR